MGDRVKKNKVELLAPAGSLDICKAVINAGADAVYLGGNLFGARAFAGNLDEQQVIEAIEYAHLRGKSIYLTVNTLLKNHELEQQLLDYMLPYYKAGLDAVIVQDMGVFKKIQDFFPDLPIHASTQMTITGSFGAKLLKNMGAARVVLARELSLAEIASIHQSCDIEIESFVHGALCYCYSGQCLLSSMNGTRSGNRGRCAQPCRLNYQVLQPLAESLLIDNYNMLQYNEQQYNMLHYNKINDNEHAYALSPKDICTLKILPEIIEAGVYALKIEGRMKNVTYAAGVTAMYRKYIDMYLKNGKSQYKVLSNHLLQEDIDYLMDIYNRGAFTTGYYDNVKGKDMMSVTRPNHMGTKALKVKQNMNGQVTFQALRAINRQDVFEIDVNHSFSSGVDVCKNDTFMVNLPKKYNLFKGRVLYRTKNAAIAKDVEQHYVKDISSAKAKVHMTLFAECGSTMTLELSALGQTVYVTGDIIQKALKNVSDEKTCMEKLSKLGNSPFVAGDIKIVIKGEVFIPSSGLNDIRRRGIDELCAAILAQQQRTPSFDRVKEKIENIKKNGIIKNNDIIKNKDVISVPNMIACNSILTVDKSVYFKDLYMDYSICETKKGWNIIDQFRAEGRHIAIALSYVTMPAQYSFCKELIEEACKHKIDSFVVRNLEQIGLLSEIAKTTAFPIKVRLDANLYYWNSEAVLQFIKMIHESGLQLERITLPYELNVNEIAEVDWKIPVECIVYGRIPVMISNQCVKKTYGMCDGANKTIYLHSNPHSHVDVHTSVDDAHIKASTIQTSLIPALIPVSCRCKECYNILWSSKILDLTNCFDKISMINPDYIRYNMSETDVNLNAYNHLLNSILSQNKMNDEAAKWTGHFITKVD